MDHTLAPIRMASPLMLADRLLTLAQDADRAGYLDAASQLITLVYAVLDQQVPSYAAIVAATGAARADTWGDSRGRAVGEPACQTRQFRGADHGIARACQPQA
jgi:type IV secretory pathway protease TraF